MGEWLIPVERRPSTSPACYHAKFGRLTLETRYSTTIVIIPNFVALLVKPFGRRYGVGIFFFLGGEWRCGAAPWDAGVDYPYPTCVKFGCSGATVCAYVEVPPLEKLKRPWDLKTR